MSETRFLGSGYESADTSSLTGAVPAHLPPRLAISLWDFSWYTQAGPGEAYADLESVFADTVHRGYNAIRICAAPLLLFGELDDGSLARTLGIEGLGTAPTGGYYGRRTRWYNTPGGYTIDLRARFLELLTLAERHGVVVILASWEYQQSSSFAADRAWFDLLDAIAPAERYDRLVRAFDAMVTYLDGHGLRKQIAFIEVHNEVDFSMLPPLQHGLTAIGWLRSRHPDLLITASYGKPPHLAMHSVPAELGLAQFHVYSYGVLDALQQLIDVRAEGTAGFPNGMLRALLADGAPTFAEYGRPDSWKLLATVITDQMVYSYDWIDTDAWDLWLYDHYGAHREAMRREIESRVVAVSAWARSLRIPAVIGEGWIGYTPLEGTFEEGPVGRDLAEVGIRAALAHGVWGMVLSSNAAPHHPMWSNIPWQQRLNAEILSTPLSVATGP